MKPNFYGDQYRQFLVTMLVTLVSVFDRPNGRTFQAFKDLRKGLESQSQGQIQSLSWMLMLDTQIAINRGIQTARKFAQFAIAQEQADELEELVNISTNALLQEIAAIALKDKSSVERVWRQYALDTKLIAAKYGSSANTYARMEKIASIKFRQPDKAGRQWQSAQALETAVRLHLVRAEIETALYFLSANGFDIVTVGWKDNKLTFSISGKASDLDNYLEIRDGVFHPNTTAEIINVVAA